MKRRRGILLVFIGLFGLLVLLVVAASLSPVQTWAARKILNSQPDLEGSIGQVTVRPKSIVVTDLDVTLPAEGVHVRAPRIEVDVSVWGLATGAISVDRLEARGWEVSLRPTAGASSTTTAAVPAATPRYATAGWTVPGLGGVSPPLAVADGAGLASLAETLQLPENLAVGTLTLAGRATWQGETSGSAISADIVLTGRDFKPDHTGHFTLTTTATGDAATAAGIRSLALEAEITAQRVGPQAIERITVDSVLTGQRLEVTEPDRYEFDFDLHTNGASGPGLDFNLRDAANRLLNGRLAAAENGDGLTGEWAVALSDESVRSLSMGWPLPKFKVAGEGNLSADTELTEITVDGALHYDLDGLQVVMPELESLGALSGDVQFAGGRHGEDIRVTALAVTLEGAAPVLRLDLLQGVELGGESQELRVAEPTKPVFALDLLGVPSTWAQPWLAPLVIDSQPVRGRFVGLASSSGLRMVTTEGIQLDGVMVAEEGRALLDEANVLVEVGVEMTADGWQVEMDRLEVSDQDGLILTASARGGQLVRESEVTRLAGRVEMNLAALQRIPVTADVRLTSGRLEADFGLGMEERVSLAASMLLADLRLPDGAALPTTQLDARLDLLTDGAIEAHLPMHFTAEGRISDLTLNLHAVPTTPATGWRVEGSLSGPRAYVADLQLLAAPFAMAEGETTAAPITTDTPATGVPTTGPIWQGVTGTFKTALGEVVLPNGMQLSDVRGDIVVEENQVQMSGLRADLGTGGSMTFDGKLDYAAASAASYSAAGTAKVDGLEVGALLRVLDPAASPPLEGAFNSTVTVSGSAASLAELADAALIEATVTSSGGVLRALGVKVDRYLQTGSKAVSALGSLLAMASGNSKVASYAAKVEAATAVASQLSALNFDQLNLELTRGTSGDVQLRDLSLISPTFRLVGQGKIDYQPGVPVWRQPLVLNIQTSAREQLATNLQTLNLLQPSEDALGYLPLVRDIKLDGSLAQIGTAQLEQLLARALQSP